LTRAIIIVIGHHLLEKAGPLPLFLFGVVENEDGRLRGTEEVTDGVGIGERSNADISPSHKRCVVVGESGGPRKLRSVPSSGRIVSPSNINTQNSILSRAEIHHPLALQHMNLLTCGLRNRVQMDDATPINVVHALVAKTKYRSAKIIQVIWREAHF
jgi:hypothetical protein